MRPRYLALFFACAIGVGLASPGCGSGGKSTAAAGSGASSSASGSGSGGDGALAGLLSLSIAPLDAVLQATPAAAATQAYTVTGTFKNKPPADVTAKITLGVANHGLGAFSGGTFTSVTTKGGITQVTATTPDGTVSASTGLTVHLTASVNGPDGGQALPADPSKSFLGTADPSRAPELVYPNDNVILPPNLKRLEVHWRTVSAKNTLFAIDFHSATADLRTYLRCPQPTDGGCIFELDPVAYGYLADSNSGGDPVELTVLGSDDQASGFGTSTTFHVTIAQDDVQGGLYYWTTTNGTAIMRFDFGGSAAMPEIFLSPSQNGFPTCVGCHAMSHDGTKMVASLGGQNDGRIVYLADVTKPQTLALDGDTKNHIQFASFNPAGDRFAAIYGDTNPPERNTLFFHDGTTGQRVTAESVVLPYEPDHPSWAPDGQHIAIDHVGLHQTSQRPINCGIELLTRSGPGWSAPAVLLPIAPGLSRYNADFAPDSSFLAFSQSTCPNGDIQNSDCDGDADPSAKTWGILPMPGASPVLLARSTAPGVADKGATDLTDTFPRFSPFQQKQGKGRLFYATISSRRRLGLRDPGGHQLLWMFAIDPDKVAAGQDGSSPAFFLPSQDLTTSNHIAQWTTAIVKPPQ